MESSARDGRRRPEHPDARAPGQPLPQRRFFGGLEGGGGRYRWGPMRGAGSRGGATAAAGFVSGTGTFTALRSGGLAAPVCASASAICAGSAAKSRPRAGACSSSSSLRAPSSGGIPGGSCRAALRTPACESLRNAWKTGAESPAGSRNDPVPKRKSLSNGSRAPGGMSSASPDAPVRSPLRIMLESRPASIQSTRPARPESGRSASPTKRQRASASASSSASSVSGRNDSSTALLLLRDLAGQVGRVGDAIEDAIDERRGVLGPVLLRQLDGLVERDLHRDVGTPQDLVDGESQDVAIDPGHPFNLPVGRAAPDDVVDDLLLALRPADQRLGEALRLLVHRIEVRPHSEQDLGGVPAARVELVERLERALACLAPRAHQPPSTSALAVRSAWTCSRQARAASPPLSSRPGSALSRACSGVSQASTPKATASGRGLVAPSIASMPSERVTSAARSA